MRRRSFLAGVVGAVATPLASVAQQMGRVWRIGCLSLGFAPTPTTPVPGLEGLRQQLHELGYVEGTNVVIECRFAADLDRLSAYAAELVRLDPDVIVTRSSPAAVAVKQATGRIPIVMVSSLDPVREGIVASLARPGGNVTGMALISDRNFIAKRLQLLKELLPGASRLGIARPALSRALLSRALEIWLKDTEAAAKGLGLTVQVLDVKDPSRWDEVFAAAAGKRVDAVYPLESPFYVFHAKHIAEVALRHRMPTVFGLREHVDAGGLLSYGSNSAAMGRRAAEVVDKVLKGAKPADLPIEQPTNFELVINLKTAKALGLTIPSSLLARADQVIQ